MKKGLLIGLGIVGVLIIVGIMIVSWLVGSYNNLVTMNEEVNKNWSLVENQYQRRADLIPNLVNTVKGYANFEQKVLTDVTEARASVGSIKATPELINDAAAFQKFQNAQANLSGALSRLLLTVENYPDLKANENFLQLQAQLEGTENRITVARNNFNESVNTYNATIKRFPAVVIAGIFGFHEKQYFQAAAGAENAPKVEF
ncbi:MAG: LemA family protein [Ignavibacteriaceae bacterium]|nr:LemA family protein [Ignavibacteriaceae bacterium]